MKTYRKLFSLFIFALLFLTLLNNLNAQPQGFVQNRFVGIQDIRGCPNSDDCDAESDGALHFRLKQLGGLGEEVFTDADGDEAVRFEVQFRAAIQDIAYNGGEVFITSTGTQAFGQNLDKHCKIIDESVFKNNPNYSVSSPQHVSPHLMKVSVTATTNVSSDTAIRLGKNTDYQTYAILECKVADTDAEAGLALHARTYTANSIWIGSGGARATKVVFVMADNDLRGFRLDGKTWAEDYLLSDDADVIVKFSKGIKTQLTEEHFTLLYTESNLIGAVESVVHSPGDDEVFISYPASSDEAILSISTNTAAILDNDDNPLAPGSFLARLDLDPPGSLSQFPRISAISAHAEQTNEYAERGLSRWCVAQHRNNSPPSFLRSTVDKDDLCLADKFSYDCLEEDGQPFIVSVFADEYTAENPENICAQFSGGQYRITLVIDPLTVQRKEEQNLDLRFKRNAVLATDLQAFRELIGLDNQIILADTIGPKITVKAMPRQVSADDSGIYTLNFTVTADEPVNNLDRDPSYKLLRVLQNNSTEVEEDGFILMNTSATDAFTVEVEVRVFAPSAEEAEDIFGYTLGYVEGGISDKGRDRGKNFVMNRPIDEAGKPLQDGEAFDLSQQAIASIDTIGPKITVRAMPRRVSADDSGTYTLSFTVTADEPVNNLDDYLSYKLLSVLQDGSTVVDEDASISPSSSPTDVLTDVLTVEVVVSTTPFAEDAENIFGYTLGYVAGGISDNGNISPIDEAGEPLQDGDAFDLSLSAIVSIRSLGCASVYPDIGQKELFVELQLPGDTTTVNDEGFVIDGQPAPQIEQVGETTEDGLSVFKVTLDEIVTAPIEVEYHQTIGTTATATARCESSLTDDSDGDGTPDIKDIDPFDADKSGVNTAVASADPLSPAPAESSGWYSRDTVIRSLIRGEHFTYSEYDQTSGTFVMKTAPTISPVDYFGIDDANARIFRISSDCQDILEFAVANNLNNVNLDGSCTDVNDNFASEPVGTHQYVWAVIRNGRLASDYISYPNVRILPELSLSGQSSYLYASPTTQSITISADVGDTNNRQVEMTRSDTSQAVSVPLMNVDTGRAEGEYHLSSEGMHPEAGQTVTHRLSESWSVTSATIVTKTGGYRLDDFEYAVFSHNRVDVRVAAADEPLSYLHRILLYDVSDEENPEQVASVVSGGKYTIVADLTTNVADISEVVSPMQDGYVIEEEVTAVAANDDFIDKKSFKSFTFTVDATEGAITVGWDSIGDMENVKARYLVTEMKHALADSDKDRIPNDHDTPQDDNKKLHVAIGGSVRDGDRDVLTTDDKDRDLFISDSGLIVALSEGGTAADYSVANIQYDQLNADTMVALGLTEIGFTTDNPIETLATFGIRNVTYTIGADGKTAEGGVTYTTFPVQSAQAGKTLYLGEYDSNAPVPQWKAFERDNTARGYSDTWYAIERPHDDEPCPTDMETYRNGHQAAGEKDMGFVAGAQNCIMLVITDGGPYDNSGSLDGRMSISLSIGEQVSFEQSLECAAFYPNIGQTELSLRLTSNLPVDTSRLTLMQDGNSLTAQVSKGDTVGAVSILTATLAEITNDADIVAAYASDDSESVVHCFAEGITEDADMDGVPDAVDSKPFDDTVQDKNTDVAMEDSLPAVPASNDYYSRDAVIRGLMRGEHFTYSEYDETSGTFVMRTAPTISLTDYFGIDDADARIFRMSSDCQGILDIAVANNLNNVNLDEFCTDVNDNFVSEPVGTHQYAWMVIRNGRLASDYISYPNVRILPELSLSGQTSYLYASPTTQSITISADVGDTNNRQVEMTRSDTSQAVSVPLMNVDTGRAEGEYHLSSEGMHPEAGQTVTHRLSESWSVTSATIVTKTGGYRLDDFEYAVFSHNRVDVRVAAADEPLSYLHRILLYDVSDEENPEQVASVVSGGKYTIVADLTTNVADISEVVSPMQDGYVIEEEVTAVAANDDFIDKKSFKSFTFTVDATEGAITVGWDSIGDMEDVKARYLVTEMAPEVADDDMDRIPNVSDTRPNDNKQLHVAIDGSVRGGDVDELFVDPYTDSAIDGSVRGGDVDVLTTDDKDRDLFISDSGLIVALSEGGTAADYSVANIQYDQLNADTMVALGLTEIGFTTDNPIETLATFGIRNVTYTIGADGKTAEGGVTYTTFPVQSAQAGKTLYLGEYDSNAPVPQWKAFERDNTARGYSDTWYAIERPHDDEPCPTDMETYRNGHQAAGEKDMGFVAGAQNCIMLVITDGGPYDNSGSLDGRMSISLSIGEQVSFEQSLECAAFYPNIGQTELSLRLTSNLPVDTSRLTLMQDGNSLTAQVSKGDTVGAVSILTATLAEITNDADIVAAYASDHSESVVHCFAEGITEDADMDGVPDAVDSKPFDDTVQDKNTDVAMEDSLPAVPASNDYYSRDAVIRGLMRGEHFTYSEYDETSGTFVMRTAPTISLTDYFGIDDADARIFRMSSDCQGILDIAVANNLNNVNLDEFCTDVNDNFVSEPVGTHQYVWMVIRNGRLASDYISYPNVRILPELSLSGQTSYLYASPTTQSITISADVGDTNNRQVEMTRSDTSQAVSVPLMNVDTGRAEGEYHLSSEGMHPEAGQTVTHRLSESWSVTSATIVTKTGGYRLDDFEYAVFSHNRVDVRVAAADEPLSYLHRILLYDVSDEENPEQVASVVSGGKYTIVADLTTNVADISEVVSPMQDGYVIEEEVTAVAANDDFIDKKSFKSFTFTVDATEGAITVGWDSIGDMENVKARYLVTEMKHALADSDKDRIPNDHDTPQDDNKKLHVAIGGSVRDGDRDVLTTDDEDRDLFISDAGLIIALGKGGDDAADYSVANIQYDQLNADTMVALGLTEIGFTTDNPIETLATFGIRNVTYAIGADGKTAVGGVTHTTVPVQSAHVGETLYISKYDSKAQTPHWKPFKRDNTAEGYSDTWYAIERPHDDESCPTDMEAYRNRHQAAGEKDMGFVASAQNCIMVVITDGGPYDNGGLDSRVVDPLSIGLELATGSDGSGDRVGGRGGGAIGGGALLLLLALLLSLIITTRNQSRLQRGKRQA